MEYKSPLSMLYNWERSTPTRIFLKQPIDDIWHTWTWEQTGREVRQLASALVALQLPPGSHIGLISKNCAHWIISDLAIMMAGHISVPLYPNLQPATILQILEHSEASLLFVGKLDDWDAMKAGVPEAVRCIALPFCKNDNCESWTNFIDAHQPLQGNPDRQKNEICSIVYTSGTTGMPKGVMYTFESFSFAAQQATRHLGFINKERFFSYLPLSHIAERMLVEMISLYIGGQVSFAESLQKFARNLAETKPTVFLGIHRIWTRFQQGILAKLPQKKLSLLLSIPIVSSIIKNRIKRQLGLGEASTILTGAAPTPPVLIKWFDSIGIKIQEAYAMTENCCYSHVTLKNNIKIGFVGQPLPHCIVKLGENNEIQIKHNALMTGYYKEDRMTLEAFTTDGFLRTGDEGFIDPHGFLKITGRVKDLFKTSKGKYVAPSPIEMKFSGNGDVEQICVVGSGLAQPVALVTLSADARKRGAEEIDARLNETLQYINSTAEAHERLEKVVVLQEEWTIENNLITPSFKIKRNEIEKKYASFYSEWYDSKGVIIWQKVNLPLG
ncbi:MAG TPA: AMP-binding protein [Chitinophagaceae bacterium]|nr:AMP-binding protein [Chitinophagaceae bacterium]